MCNIYWVRPISLVSDTAISLNSTVAVSGKSLFYFSSTCNTKAVDITQKPHVACSARIVVDRQTHTHTQDDLILLLFSCFVFALIESLHLL